MSVTGDLTNNLRKLNQQLKKLKYHEYDLDGISKGFPSSYLPIYHFLFLEYSLPLVSEIAARRIIMTAITDFKFIETMYKVLRDIFNYKATINKSQFFQSGFAERKIIMCNEIISLLKEYHKYKSKPALISKAKKPTNKEKEFDIRDAISPCNSMDELVTNHIVRLNSSPSDNSEELYNARGDNERLANRNEYNKINNEYVAIHEDQNQNSANNNIKYPGNYNNKKYVKEDIIVKQTANRYRSLSLPVSHVNSSTELNNSPAVNKTPIISEPNSRANSDPNSKHNSGANSIHNSGANTKHNSKTNSIPNSGPNTKPNSGPNSKPNSGENSIPNSKDNTILDMCPIIEKSPICSSNFIPTSTSYDKIVNIDNLARYIDSEISISSPIPNSHKEHKHVDNNLTYSDVSTCVTSTNLPTCSNLDAKDYDSSLTAPSDAQALHVYNENKERVEHNQKKPDKGDTDARDYDKGYVRNRNSSRSNSRFRNRASSKVSGRGSLKGSYKASREDNHTDKQNKGERNIYESLVNEVDRFDYKINTDKNNKDSRSSANVSGGVKSWDLNARDRFDGYNKTKKNKQKKIRISEVLDEDEKKNKLGNVRKVNIEKNYNLEYDYDNTKYQKYNNNHEDYISRENCKFSYKQPKNQIYKSNPIKYNDNSAKTGLILNDNKGITINDLNTPYRHVRPIYPYKYVSGQNHVSFANSEKPVEDIPRCEYLNPTNNLTNNTPNIASLPRPYTERTSNDNPLLSPRNSLVQIREALLEREREREMLRQQNQPACNVRANLYSGPQLHGYPAQPPEQHIQQGVTYQQPPHHQIPTPPSHHLPQSVYQPPLKPDQTLPSTSMNHQAQPPLHTEQLRPLDNPGWISQGTIASDYISLIADSNRVKELEMQGIVEDDRNPVNTFSSQPGKIQNNKDVSITHKLDQYIEQQNQILNRLANVEKKIDNLSKFENITARISILENKFISLDNAENINDNNNTNIDVSERDEVKRDFIGVVSSIDAMIRDTNSLFVNKGDFEE